MSIFDRFGMANMNSGFNDDDSRRSSRSTRSRSSQRSYDDDDGMRTRSGRRSTGRNPGTVTDPDRDGRVNHGRRDTGMRGERLLSEDEWIEAHRVPHPGARGNQNARGPHNIPEDSMERIREGGRKGGEAHRGMRFQRVDDMQSGGTRRRSTRRSSNDQDGNQGRFSSRVNSNRTSRSSRSGMNTSGRGYSGRQSEDQSLEDLRDAVGRLNEVLGRIA